MVGVVRIGYGCSLKVTASTERSNEDWLRQLRAGGIEASAAVAVLRGVVRGGVRRAVVGHAGASDALIDDLTQDATMKVLGALASFRGESRFTTWVITISVRVAFAELRRARWRDVSLEQLASRTNGPPEVAAEDAHAQAAREAMLAALQRALDSELTERQRQALLGELRGMAQSEIAAQLNTNRNALYKLTHDARLKLKRGLLTMGFSEHDVRETFDLSVQEASSTRGAP